MRFRMIRSSAVPPKHDTFRDCRWVIFKSLKEKITYLI